MKKVLLVHVFFCPQLISNTMSKKRIGRDLSSQKDTSNSRKNTSNRKKMVGYIFFYHEQFPFHIKKLDQLCCWKHSEKYWNMLQLPHQYIITHAVFWWFGWNLFHFWYKKILSFGKIIFAICIYLEVKSGLRHSVLLQLLFQKHANTSRNSDRTIFQ